MPLRDSTVRAGIDSDKIQKEVAANLPKTLTALDGQKNVVGFVYLLNGKLQSADLFGSPRILTAARESLLKGYLSEGASVAANSNAKVDMESIRKFLTDVIEGRESRMPALKMNTSGLYRGRATRGVELKAGASDASGFVHGNYSPSKR